MSITSIIVNYHTAEFLPDLLQDLSHCPDITRVFVVDNSGEVALNRLTADAAIDFSDALPKLKVLHPGKNIGFAAGVNLAADQTESEYILLVNPDVRLLPGCIDNLINAAVSHQAVVAGPRFFWDDAKQYKLPPSQGTTSWMAFALSVSESSPLDCSLLSFYWEIRHERFWEKTKPFPEPFLSGACLLINRKWACQNRQSVFDPCFFLYHEDNDICVRAVNDGLPPLCVPDAEAIHYYNQAPDPEEGKMALMMDSHNAYKKKYYPHVNWTIEVMNDPSNTIDDILLITDVATFEWGRVAPLGRLFFEIGMHKNFVPFAQMEIHPHGHKTWPRKYSIPPEIMKRLASGIYYSRLRDEIKGTLKVWKWQKE